MIPLPPARMGVALSDSQKGVVISGPLLNSKCGISPSLSLVRNTQFSVFFSSSYRVLLSACPPYLWFVGQDCSRHGFISGSVRFHHVGNKIRTRSAQQLKRCLNAVT